MKVLRKLSNFSLHSYLIPIIMCSNTADSYGVTLALHVQKCLQLSLLLLERLNSALLYLIHCSVESSAFHETSLSVTSR